MPFPFTDLTGNKVRPALIISKKNPGNDIVVLFVTTKFRGKNAVIILPDVGNGLKVKSAIVCSKIATLDTATILGELGMLSALMQKKVDATLRTVLGL